VGQAQGEHHVRVAWEWLGWVVTGGVGIAGIWGTRSGARQQVDGQIKIAREERQQRRIEAAYTELLGNLIACEDYANKVFFATMAGQPPLGVEMPPGFSSSLGGDGSLAVYWSPRVRQLVGEMRNQIRELHKLLVRYHRTARDAGATSEDQVLAMINAAAPKAEAAQRAIVAVRDQMSAELNPGAPPRA
jgi:hypothetical protein